MFVTGCAADIRFALNDKKTTMQENYYIKNLDAFSECFPLEADSLQRDDSPMKFFVDVLDTDDYAVFEVHGEHKTIFNDVKVYYRDKIFAEMKQEVKRLTEQSDVLATFAFLFCGLDAGIRLWYLFNNAPRNTTVYIIERHAALLRALFERFDLSDMIRSGRVHFFCGVDADKRFLKYIKEEPVKMPLWHCCVFRDNDRVFYENVLIESLGRSKDILAELVPLEARVMMRYEALDKSGIARAFSDKHRPLNVLTMLSSKSRVNQYVTRDCMDGLKDLGHNALVLEDDYHQSMPAYYFFKALDTFRPDLYFCINHCLRAVWPYSDNLIGITWLLDPLHYFFNPRIPVTSKVGSCDQIFVMSRGFMTQELLALGIPRAQLHHLYFGADTKKYQPLEKDGIDDTGSACDISYTGNYYDCSACYRMMPRAFVDELYREMVQTETFYPYHVKEIIARLEKTHGKLVLPKNLSQIFDPGMDPDFILMTQGWLALSGAALKNSYLESIMDMDLRIYGGGWEEDERFARKCHGFSPPGEAASKVFSRSKINLHLGSFTNNHPRIFNVIASGGFLLAHVTPEDEGVGGIGDLFEIGTEIEVFRTKKEMREKIEYYLTHEHQRSEIARRGYQRLLRQHTMKHRMQQVLDIVHEGLTGVTSAN